MSRRLPEDWKYRKLEQLVLPKEGIRRGPFGGALKKEIFVADGFKVYQQSNVIRNDWDHGDYFIDAEKYGEMLAFQIRPGDFLVSCSGTIGRIVMVPQNAKLGVINQALLRIRLNEKIVDPSYFLYQFRSDEMQKMIVDNTQGGAMQNLVAMSTFREVEFAIPLIPEQHKIVEILSTWDEAIATTERLITALQSRKMGLMQRLLTGQVRFPGFAGAWHEYRFEQIAAKNRYSFTGGPFGSNLKTESYTPTGVRIIQLQNIGDGEFLDTYKIYTSKEKADELFSCNIFPGDIILSKMGDPVARATVIPNTEKRFLMASDGIRLEVDKKHFDAQFILETINAFEFRKNAIRRSVGSTRQRIGLSDLRKLPLKIPSLDEQQKIAAILQTSNNEIDLHRRKLDALKQQKKGLMQRLLTGQVRVKLEGEKL